MNMESKDKQDRRGGQRRGRGKKRGEKSDIEQRLLDVARVARVVKGGRRFSFRATVVVGDRKGRVGVGVSKGADVAAAVNKAVYQAKKAMITVPIIKGTIPHEILTKVGSGKVFLKPGREGGGIIAGGAVRAVCELAGIVNIVSKTYGTNNKLTNAQVAIEALGSLSSPEETLKLRGKVKKGSKD